MLSLDELSTIDRFANKHDLFVLSDEIYDRICYETPHVSPASLPGLAQRTLTLNGFSKAYAMTGWRLGYVAGNRDLITQILRVQQHIVTCAASFAQEAAVAALVGSQEPLHNMRREYRKRRDVMVSTLNAIPGVSCPLPAGAFYAFPRFERYHSSAKLASQLLDKAAVSSIPGIAFGEAGEGHIRFSYACEMQEIEKGMERLNKLLS
jgi:aspartate/methionine/tyrosine aminotransferase